MTQVSIEKLWNLATVPGQPRMEYGVYWALNKMMQRGVTARYENGSHVTFKAWFSNKEANFILPRLTGATRKNGGYELSAWFGGTKTTVTYWTKMMNGNIIVDIEWVDLEREKQIREEEEDRNAKRSEVLKFVLSSMRDKVSDEQIKATVMERYGITDLDKFFE